MIEGGREKRGGDSSGDLRMTGGIREDDRF